MGSYIIAYDLGTGGNKASLYDEKGTCLRETFISYPTHYPRAGWHEQKPEDWWEAIVKSTRELLKTKDVDKSKIVACGISGHSLGAVPVTGDCTLLRESTPIWSDSRPTTQTGDMFQHINEADWYRITGNGFPAALYTVFKIMWYRDREPEMYERIHKVIGTKDYVNMRLTGRIVTDYSYASGSGVYDLTGWKYNDDLIKASGLSPDIFPEIVPSTEVIGTLTTEAAEALGLPKSVKVVAGGVDNSCMALGARNTKEGRLYNSQGSSSWIAVASAKPLLDDTYRPYVFAHVIPALFTSAVGVFSTGSSFRWIRDRVCVDLVLQAEQERANAYDLMTRLAADSPAGANGMFFNPSLGGGSSLDASINIRGAFLGIDLGHTRADMIRATMEGIAFEQRRALDALRGMTELSDEMLVVGGGSRSPFWLQIFADVYNMRLVKTNIDQQAAALGAAALAAIGAGLWDNFKTVDEIHEVESIIEPIPESAETYQKLLPGYTKAGKYLAEIGDWVTELDQQG